MIDTKNLILRPFTLDDTEKVYKMSIEVGMKKWIPDQVYADRNESHEVLEFLISCYNEPDPKIKPFVLGIELKETGELIGHVGLSPLNGEVEIGYAIEEIYHGRGFATEAVKSMSEWAVQYFSISSIFGIVASENTGSVKVLEKSGYLFAEEKERKAFGIVSLCREYKYNNH